MQSSTTALPRPQPASSPFYLLASIVAAIVLLAFLPALNHGERAELGRMVYGTAHRPFVYRTLLPTTVRSMTLLTPDAVEASIEERLWGAFGSQFAAKNVPQEHVLEALLTLLLMYAAALGFIFAFRMLAGSLFVMSGALLSGLSLLAALLLIPSFFAAYIYDLPAIFLFTLGLALMVRQQWASFLAVYSLGNLNKETMVFLALVFAVHFFFVRRLSWGRYASLLAAQGLIFAVIKLGLEWAFQDNPGSVVENNILYGGLVYFQIFYQFPLFMVCCLGSAFVLLPGLLLYRWQEHSPFLRHASVIILPLLLLFFFFGFPFEIRVFGEVYPIFFLMLAYRLLRLRGLEITVLR